MQGPMVQWFLPHLPYLKPSSLHRPLSADEAIELRGFLQTLVLAPPTVSLSPPRESERLSQDPKIGLPG